MVMNGGAAFQGRHWRCAGGEEEGEGLLSPEGHARVVLPFLHQGREWSSQGELRGKVRSTTAFLTLQLQSSARCASFCNFPEG